MPRTAILYIAQRCNQRCVFCLEDDKSWREFVDPETVEIRAELARLFAKGAQHITFMGGETFFRKDLCEILEEAKLIGYTRIGVTTNGTVLSKKGLIGRLEKAGLDFIELSVHAHTEALTETISGVDITWSRQAVAMTEIGEAGVGVIVNVVVCRENKDHLAEVAEYALSSLPNNRKRLKFKFVSLQGGEAERAESAAPLRYDEVDFIALGDALVARGADFWTYNVPLCRLGRHASHSHEVMTLATDERYFDMDHTDTLTYFDSGHQLDGHVWPEHPCGDCTVRMLCPGMEESHRRAIGTDALVTRTDAPLPILEEALRGLGLPTAAAGDRLQALLAEPRPKAFAPSRPTGALRLTHASLPLPVDLDLLPRLDDTRGYAKSTRFVLTYLPWSVGHPLDHPLVKAMLDAAGAALNDADDAGTTREGAIGAVMKCALGLGFVAPPVPTVHGPRPQLRVIDNAAREIPVGETGRRSVFHILDDVAVRSLTEHGA